MLQRPILLYRGLKDFLVCKYFFFTKKYTYPSSILPKKCYKPKIDLNAIINVQELIVSRRSNFSIEDTFTITGTLKEKVLSSKDVIGLSLNLMGRFFLPSYIKFIPIIKTVAVENWKGGSTIFLSDFFDLYRINNDCTCIFYQATDLHNKHLPYTKQNDKEALKFFKVVKVKYEEEEDNLVVHCRSFIEHVPTNLNYWHAEVKLTDPELNEFKKNTNLMHQAISDLMFKHILSVKAFVIDKKEIKKIDKKFYLLRKYCLLSR